MLKPTQIFLICIMIGALIVGALAFLYDDTRLNSATPSLNITKIEGIGGCTCPISQICISFNLTIDNPSNYPITLKLSRFNASTILCNVDCSGIHQFIVLNDTYIPLFLVPVQFTLSDAGIVTIPPRSQSYTTIWTEYNLTMADADWVIERLLASGGGDHVEWQWIVYSDWFGTLNTKVITYNVSLNWSSPTEFAVCK